MKTTLLKLGLLAGWLAAGSFRAWALDSAVVIANASVAADRLSPDELKDIYTAKTKYWEDGQAIIIIVLPDKTEAGLKQASGMDGSQFKTFWQRLAFSGRGSEPKKAGDLAALVTQVAATKGAIALAPTDAALAGVKKIEIEAED